jgi:hypothetical protein
MTEEERAALKREIERRATIARAVRLAVESIYRPNGETVH